MRIANRGLLVLAAGLVSLLGIAGTGHAEYPPRVSEIQSAPFRGNPPGVDALIFTNNHNYGSIEILVQVYDNYLGDFNKYHWVYTVTNHTFDPNPGVSNGFSGFELALTQFVPDIADLSAPDAAWIYNCCSGQPVEWDKTNTGGLGVPPGGVGVFSFTTLPRLITISPGWFHTWETDGQTNVTNYPQGEGPESPDLEDTTPHVELCCYIDPTGVRICGPVTLGTCTTLPGGSVVTTCDECETVGTDKPSWGKTKSRYR